MTRNKLISEITLRGLSAMTARAGRPGDAHAACIVESLTALQREVRRLARLFKCYVLRPGPGRPRHPRVTLATKLRYQGKTWAEIFGACLPDRAVYESGIAYRNAKANLKKAVLQREKRIPPITIAQ